MMQFIRMAIVSSSDICEPEAEFRRIQLVAFRKTPSADHGLVVSVLPFAADRRMNSHTALRRH
ncbi:MAG: hypothetical protein WBH50_11320 [Fuerstiella sp.]